MNSYRRLISRLLIAVFIVTAFPTQVLAETLNSQSKQAYVEPQLSETEVQASKAKNPPKILKEVEEKREENIKHFLLDDNTYEAVIYEDPVHYKENGKWQDIDNSLVEAKDKQGNSLLENKKNDFKVKIDKKSNSEKLVSINKDKYEISWKISKSKNSYDKVKKAKELKEVKEENGENDILNEQKTEVSENEEEEESTVLEESLIKEVEAEVVETAPKESIFSLTKKDEDEDKKNLKNISSKVKYENIEDKVNLEYNVTSKKVKESIVLNEKIDNPNFEFILKAKNLTAKLNEDKSISFYDSLDNKKLVYTMESPYMYDNIGELSQDIEVILEEKGNNYILTLLPNKEWLDSEKRVHPITIDPTIGTPQDINSIKDSYVAEGVPGNNYGGIEFLQVGKGSVTGTNRSYISFNLPTIKSTNIITEAYLYLWLNQANSTPTQIDVHKVNSAWNSGTITWNNKPGFNSKIEDYDIVSGDQYSGFMWDITSIAKEWTSTGINNGLMLKNHNEATGYSQFISSDSQSGLLIGRPKASIVYTDSTGLEGYWTYHSQNVGRAGTGYVNDYNGNLIFVHNDLSMNGNRMPISLSHVFNSNEKATSTGYGNGWRLNLSQRVLPETIAGIQYYAYTDEDGTKHYLKYNSTEQVYKDETGIDITMTINSSSTNERYRIKDKKDNQLLFTASGYLYKIQDNNGNALILSYEGTVLKSVTDGSGRVTTFDVSEYGYLLGIIDPSGRRTSFAYNGTKLSRITYPDEKFTTYTYNTHNNLESVKNFDGYKMSYVYYDVVPYRVKQIIETNKDNSAGEGINIKYGYNSTTYNDHRGNKEIYQFNNSGNTIAIRDDEGNALYYDYGKDQSTKNKLSFGSKLQKSIMNYVKNHNAEIVGNWTAVNDGNTNGSSTYDTTIKYRGAQSLKTEKLDNLNRRFHKQQVTLTKGNTYTLSAYIKTDNVSNDNKKGAAVFVTYQDETGATKNVYSDYVSGSNDWKREEVTFTLPGSSTSNIVEVNVGIVNESGAAYFDAIQLEDGSLANRYNMLENPNFIHETGGNPEFWSKNPYTDSNDMVLTSSDSSYPIKLDNSKKVFRINGRASLNKNIYQKINQSGNIGDVFVVSGWAKGDSVPLGGNRYFALDVGIEKLDGSYEWKVIPFNEDSTEWQYTSKKIVTGVQYKSITFYALYYGNENTAYFDGLQLYKEEFGQSYQYDSKGNLISTEDLAKQKSQFQYSASNDLIKSTNINGGEFNYIYDSKHNIKEATSSENVKYSFQYDDSENGNGNVTKSTIGDPSGITIQSEAEYTPDGNYLSEIKDSSGNKVSYNYDTTKGNLVKTTDARGNSVFYSYDSMDRLTKVETKGLEVFSLTNSVTGTRGTTPYINDAIFDDDENGKFVLRAIDNKRLVYSLGLGLNSGTMATWVKPGTSTTSRYILDSQGASSSVLSIYLDTNNKINLAVRNSSDNGWNPVIPGTSTVAVAADTWNYVAVTWSKSEDNKLTFNLYLNGEVYTKNGIDADTIKNFAGATTSLGMHNSGAYSVNGLMDQFIYSGSALTGDEISDIRDDGRGNYEEEASSIKNTYTYKDDKIKTVEHNGFSYTFNYDDVGNNKGVSIGGQNLITNEYQLRTKLLKSSTYGNGASVSYQYDSEDRISSKSTNNGKNYEYSYDANGNLGLLKETVGGTSIDYRYLYDASDRLVKVKESNGNVMSYNYDKGSNLSTFQEKVNGIGYITSYDYDKDNRITDIYYKNPLMNSEGTEYFPLNNSLIGSRGTKPYSIGIGSEKYEKDTTITDSEIKQKRVLKTDSNTKILYDLGIKQDKGTMGVWFKTEGGTSSRYILDSRGEDNSVLSMYLDANNKLNLAVRNSAGVWVPLVPSTEAVALNTWNYAAFTWSLSGTTLNVKLYVNDEEYSASTTDFKDFSGAKTALCGTVSGTHQLDGQLEGLSTYNKALTSEEVDSIYEAGRNNKVNFKYDNLGRLTHRTVNTGVVDFVTKYSFEAGKEENITTTRVSEIDNNSKKIAYTYDQNGNIKTITEDEKVITYYYDELNQLIREDNKVLDKTITYTYDAGGNMLNKTEYAYTTGTLGEVTSTVSYGYTDSNWKDKLTKYNEKPITYDAIGNPETYDNYTFTWEQGRQLAGINIGGKNISFKYNVDGIRTEKTVDGVTTKYRLVGDKVTFEDNVTDKIYYTYDASSDLVSMNLNGVEYWYIRNAQGDIIGLFDENGATVASYTYDSWGKLISIKDGNNNDITNDETSVGYKNPYRYRGYRYDTETKLYYLNSRYYNPEWGRFINADAAVGQTGSIQGHNMFQYCFNNPVNMDDPSGYWPKLSTILTAVAVVATVVAIGAVVVATAGAAAPAFALAGGAVLGGSAGGAAGVAAAAGVVAIGAGAASVGVKAVEKSMSRSSTQSYTVYALADDNGEVKYVGRTKNFNTRMKQHQKPGSRTEGLTPKVRIDNLSYAQARGLEQLGMTYYHTRAFMGENGKNLINGISPKRWGTTPYLDAGRAMSGYLYNQISNEILCWTE